MVSRTRLKNARFNPVDRREVGAKNSNNRELKTLKRASVKSTNPKTMYLFQIILEDSLACK
jgi:hypothetical protein